jgi:hypothetical protein
MVMYKGNGHGTKTKGTKMNETLRAERKKLNEYVSMTYSPSNFPGSKGWRLNQQCQAKLDAFDVAHPEVIAEIEEENKASKKTFTWDEMNQN